MVTIIFSAVQLPVVNRSDRRRLDQYQMERKRAALPRCRALGIIIPSNLAGSSDGSQGQVGSRLRSAIRRRNNRVFWQWLPGSFDALLARSSVVPVGR
jgi:hypothetical protein